MNKLILSPLTLLEGKAQVNDKGDIRFNGRGSFHEAYGDRAIREIQLLAFGKAAERLKDIEIGSKLEAHGKYRSETRELSNRKKEYLHLFVIGKITKVGKSSETGEVAEIEEAIAPIAEAKKTVTKTKVAPVYTPPAATDDSSDTDDDSIPF